MELVKKAITIPTSLKILFKQYLSLTKPLNGLRPLEIEVLSLYLYYNFLEMDNFKKDEDRWKKIFSYETKMKIKEELDIKDYTLQNIMSSLRRKKVIVNGGITDYYIPKIQKDTKDFQVIFNFSIKDE